MLPTETECEVYSIILVCISMRIHNLACVFQNVYHNVRVMLIAYLSPNVHNYNILRLKHLD